MKASSMHNYVTHTYNGQTVRRAACSAALSSVMKSMGPCSLPRVKKLPPGKTPLTRLNRQVRASVLSDGVMPTARGSPVKEHIPLVIINILQPYTAAIMFQLVS